MYGNPIDPNTIGQGRQYPNPSDAYDAAHGKYSDQLPAIATEAKLPTQQMPMAPAPSPFVIKSSGTGER
jgi:hypothetical protein